MKTITTLLFLLCITKLSFAQVLQPVQSINGPGGSDYTHTSVAMHSYDPLTETGVFIFEPGSPTPDSANVIVFVHGLTFVNPDIYGGWIRHLVQHGNIVIFPKYQNALGTTLTSAFNTNTVTGIKRALDTLANPGHVKPRLQNFAVVGHSYGGLIAPNMVLLAPSSGFPTPKAAFSCQGYMDLSFTTRLPDYSIMPSNLNLLIAVGDNDVVVGTTFGHFLMDSTVNIPTSHKNLITHHADLHGSPTIGSTHLEPCSMDMQFNSGETNTTMAGSIPLVTTDAVDYFCYWKLFDALLDCAFYGTNCNYAFGDTPEQHGMGQWSDGQAIVPITVEPAAFTGIKESDYASDLNIYPNPTTDEVTINISLPNDEKIALELYNEIGQKTFSTVEFAKKGTLIKKVKFNTLAPGVYFLKISGNSFQRTKRFIIK